MVAFISDVIYVAFVSKDILYQKKESHNYFLFSVTERHYFAEHLVLICLSLCLCTTVNPRQVNKLIQSIKEFKILA